MEDLTSTVKAVEINSPAISAPTPTKAFLPMMSNPNFDRIPQILKDLPRWLCWQLQPTNPKPKKIPMTPKSGHLVKAAVNKTKNWLTFDEAISWYNRGECSGIGFALTKTTPKVCCVDIDHCYNSDGILTDEAKAVIRLCGNSWTEKSQSGIGLHVWFIDNDFNGEHGRKKGDYEVYAFDRYIAMTGNHVEETAADLLTINGTCNAVIEKFIDGGSKNLFSEKTAPVKVKEQNIKADETTAPMNEADQKLIEYLRSDKCRKHNVNTFFLFTGRKTEYFKNTGKEVDDSVADIDLMLKILFYVGSEGNDEAITQRALKIFGQSELAKRDKWTSREDYRLRTLDAAFVAWTENGRKCYQSKSTYEAQLAELHAQPQSESRDKKIISVIRNCCDWNFRKDENGIIKKTTIRAILANVDKIFDNDPNLIGLFGKDTFQDEIVFLKKAPWHETDRTGDKLRDNDEAQLRLYLRRNYAELREKQLIEDYIIGYAEKNSFNPVKQFFEILSPWDGTPRAETLFIKFLGAEDTPYTREVTMKWLIGLIARIYYPGCDFQWCIVIQGGQRIGKSRLLKMLGGKEGVNPNGYHWHVALQDSVDDSHAVDALQTGAIIEIEEFSAARKAEVNKLKSFISAHEDTRRFAYDRRATTRPRHSVFAVTCNDSQFLRDPTGNARFWVVECTQEKFRRVDGMTPEYIRQVLAEAYFKFNELFKDGFDESKLRPSLELEIQAEKIAENFTQDDGLTSEIKAFLDKRIPPAVVWNLMTKEERRKFFVDGQIIFAQSTLNFRRRARGGRDVDTDINEIWNLLKSQRQDIQEFKTQDNRELYIFYGSEYRMHICAAEIYNECFCTGDKRKLMYRISEILDSLDGWHLGDRLQKADSEYREQKKPYYRDKDNCPADVEDTKTDSFDLSI